MTDGFTFKLPGPMNTLLVPKVDAGLVSEDDVLALHHQ